MSWLTALMPALMLAQTPATAPAETPAPVRAIAASSEWSVETTPEGIRLVADVFGAKTELSTVKVGAVNDAVRLGGAVYVAKAAGGIDLLDARNPRAPESVGTFGQDYIALNLAIRGDELVAVSKGQSFVLYDLSNPFHPMRLASALSSEKLPRARGKVLAAHDGVLIINGGTAEGFAQGQNIAVYSSDRLSEKDKVAREAGMQTPGMLVAVVRLERVEAERSLGSYGRGDDPKPGDAVVTTSESTTAALVAPRLVPFEWRVDLSLRSFLGVGGDDGYTFGLLTDVSVAYYFKDIPLRLEVGLVPFGVVLGGSVPYNPVVFDATAAFYSEYLEFGLGGGFSTVAVPASALQPQTLSTQGTIDQTLRLGAIDGLNLLWASSFGYGSSSFELASIRAQFNVPVSARVTLGFEGGGGRGFGYGDGVLRTYIGGLGGPGTLIVSAGIGGATTIANIPNNSPFLASTQSAAGPALVFGLEGRF